MTVHFIQWRKLKASDGTRIATVYMAACGREPYRSARHDGDRMWNLVTCERCLALRKTKPTKELK